MDKCYFKKFVMIYSEAVERKRSTYGAEYPAEVQRLIDHLKAQELYIHLEMTTGAYAA